MIKNFSDFLLESENHVLWKEIDFQSNEEKTVSDVAEESLLTPDLVVVYEGTSAYTKLTQITSSENGEEVLKITGNRLTMYTVPFDFLKWETLGASSETIETCFIVSEINTKKI